MQQKKTPTIDVDELPALTPSQELYARGLLDGLSQADAYRAAYNAANMSDNSVWREASVLKSHPKISQWLKAARIAGLERGALTHEQYINRLLELAARAEAAGNYGAAVNAITNAGKAAGHMIERIEDMTPVERREARDKLARLASKPPAEPVTTEHRTLQ